MYQILYFSFYGHFCSPTFPTSKYIPTSNTLYSRFAIGYDLSTNHLQGMHKACWEEIGRQKSQKRQRMSTNQTMQDPLLHKNIDISYQQLTFWDTCFYTSISHTCFQLFKLNSAKRIWQEVLTAEQQAELTALGACFKTVFCLTGQDPQTNHWLGL